MTPHVRLGPVVGRARTHYVTAGDVHGVRRDEDFRWLLLLEEVSSQPLHISPSQCQRTGFIDSRSESLHPIQLLNSVLRCWPREHLRAIASRVHHEVGPVIDYCTSTTSSYHIVAMCGCAVRVLVGTFRARTVRENVNHCTAEKDL
jgi:hypothetical protein